MKCAMWLVPLVMVVSLALCGMFGDPMTATGTRVIVLLACGAAGMLCLGGWRKFAGDDGDFQEFDSGRRHGR